MEEAREKKRWGLVILKLALFLLILVIIAGAVLYSFFDINPADVLTEGITGLYHRAVTIGSKELIEKEKLLFTYDNSEMLFSDTVSDNLVVATISYVKYIDPDGQEKAYIPVNLKKPYVEAYKDDVLIADLEGRYFALINNGKILWEKNIDEDIVNASISGDWILIITNSSRSGYKRTVRAFSKDGQEISLRNISNYFPFDVYHFPEFSKTSFVVNGVEVSGLETNGLLELLNLSMEQKASIKGIREVFGGGIPLVNETLMLYGENSVTVIDNTYKTVWESKPEGFIVTCAHAIKKEFPVIAQLNSDVLEREKRNETKVVVLNSNGTKRAELSLNEKVTAIETAGKTAALKAGSEVIFINHDGEIMDVYTSMAGVSNVHLAKENLAYIVSGGSITRVRIKVKDKFLGIF